ncbi:hypothetical protein [Mesorhizobium sp. LjRoot246]|uniref:hypothetical protein n=1 Tax=Mesorhizobium sp. LjRoot246 TaxID=3342294 RepID=UPI003ED0AF50
MRLQIIPLLFAGLLLLVAGDASWANGSDKCAALTPASSPLPDKEIGILVEHGSQAEADAYYATFKSKINLDLSDATQSTLDYLVQSYFGYGGLSAADLELLASSELMPRNQTQFLKLASEVRNPALLKASLALHDFTGDRVLVTRFFAPKIVNFANHSDGLFTAGWRKLVRLDARPKSLAAGAGLRQMYLLFNYVSNDADPFAQPDGSSVRNFSKNNQVILIPRTFKKCEEDSLKWMVYGPFDKGYTITSALNAAFDFPGPQDYFVPRACAQCHGHDEEFGGALKTSGGVSIFPYGKINYLDSDQWYDALFLDFPQIAIGSADVIFDGGKNHSSHQYRNAEGVIAKLNRGARDQNVLAERRTGSFQVRAVKKWLALHNSGSGPQKLETRILAGAGGVSWNPSDPLEMETLRLLNRYCFRCHSSMLYNVFDKAGLLEPSVRIPKFRRNEVASRFYLVSKTSDPPFMPQGRLLDDLDRQKLVDYLAGLK